MTDQKKSFLQTIWERTEETWDSLKQNRAQANLRAKAEVDLLALQSKVYESETKLEKVVIESKTTQAWEPIRKAALERDLLKKELENACDLYKSFFGELPNSLMV